MSRSVRSRVIAASLGALVVVLVLAPSSGAAKAAAKSCTVKHKVTTCVFSYTGRPVKWVVPTGVTGVAVSVFGAQGGVSAHNGTGGLGGEATANLAVKAGSVLQMDVGGAGLASKGGWNGGGSAGAITAGDVGNVSTGGGGGGASDVRTSKCVAKLTCTMAQALLVAGGGGGGGDATYDPSNSNFPGASGGGLSGGSASSGGGGGTQTTGGGGGYNGECYGGGKGALGQGGAGGSAQYGQYGSCEGGAGGGGGYYGGGGAGSDEVVAEAGGGGSGYGPLGSTRVTFASGVQTGNGSIAISWPVAKKAPTITSGASAKFPTGTTSAFTVTTGPPAEWPIPKLKVVGSLPAGVTFVDDHDGTGRLTGKPSASVAGSHPFQIVASNGVGPQAVQKFALAVGAAPQITSKSGPGWPLSGTPETFTITTSGDPAPTTITETGTLPNGLTFKNNGDGTATISGAPNETKGPVIGAYPITLKASQTGGSTWPATTQSATVYVDDVNQFVDFTLNATGTDSTPLNPGIGLAVNGTACYAFLSGTLYFPWCAPKGFENFFGWSNMGLRGCGGISVPLPTSASVAGCDTYSLSWDPLDDVTLSAPATTTVGDVTYEFLFWDTSGQSVACNGGNTNPDCTFAVPSGGVDVNAVYVPLP